VAAATKFQRLFGQCTRGGTLSFDLPVTGAPASSARPALPPQVPEGSNATTKLLTEAELRSLERDNLLAPFSNPRPTAGHAAGKILTRSMNSPSRRRCC
jgi:hypothetical protein